MLIPGEPDWEQCRQLWIWRSALTRFCWNCTSWPSSKRIHT